MTSLFSYYAWRERAYTHPRRKIVEMNIFFALISLQKKF